MTRTKKIDKKGVSPVIGVILMVAATIVISGVVIAMLGGFSAPEAAPAVQFNIGVTADDNVTFTHVGGETVAYADMTATITQGSNADLGLPLIETVGNINTGFEAGEKCTATVSNCNFSQGTGTRVEVTVMYLPTGAILWSGAATA